jgi:hypothetical protein
MPTVSAKINSKEYDVITHYANACGETISNLIRKVLISEATFLHGFGGSKEYDCGIMIPDDCTSEEEEEEDNVVKEAYNRSRRILGFEEIDKL